MGLVSSVKGKMVMRQKLARSGMKREAKKREEGGRRRVSNSKNENQQPTIILCTGSTYCIGFSGSQSYFNHVAQNNLLPQNPVLRTAGPSIFLSHGSLQMEYKQCLFIRN